MKNILASLVILAFLNHSKCDSDKSYEIHKYKIKHNGVQLQGYKWLPVGEARALVFISHGLETMKISFSNLTSAGLLSGWMQLRTSWTRWRDEVSLLNALHFCMKSTSSTRNLKHALQRTQIGLCSAKRAHILTNMRKNHACAHNEILRSNLSLA